MATPKRTSSLRRMWGAAQGNVCGLAVDGTPVTQYTAPWTMSVRGSPGVKLIPAGGFSALAGQARADLELPLAPARTSATLSRSATSSTSFQRTPASAFTTVHPRLDERR